MAAKVSEPLVKTGIEGLDAMLYGGIPQTNQIVLAGGPGAGKTLLAFEFLYRNADMGENCVFIGLEEDPERVIGNAKRAFSRISGNIDKMIGNGKLNVVRLDPLKEMYSEAGGDPDYAFGKLVQDLESVIERTNATRVVIDSSSVLEILIQPVSFRKSMLSLVNNFRRLGITSLMTSEMPSPERSKLEFKPEYFAYDGIITMYQVSQRTTRMLAIEVIKMRGSRHSFVTTPYEITGDGIKVLSAEEALS